MLTTTQLCNQLDMDPVIFRTWLSRHTDLRPAQQGRRLRFTASDVEAIRQRRDKLTTTWNGERYFTDKYVCQRAGFRSVQALNRWLDWHSDLTNGRWFIWTAEEVERVIAARAAERGAH